MISKPAASHGNLVVSLVSWAVNTDFPACCWEPGTSSSLLIQTGKYMFNKTFVYSMTVEWAHLTNSKIHETNITQCTILQQKCAHMWGFVERVQLIMSYEVGLPSWGIFFNQIDTSLSW